MNLKSIWMAAALAGVTHGVSAQMVWVERSPDQGARAYYGEWVDDTREPKVRAVYEILAKPRGRDAAHLARAGTMAGFDAIGIDGASRRDVRLQNPIVFDDDLVKFEARVGRTSTACTLDLELVPASANSNTLTLMFKGEPLAGKAVTVFGPTKSQYVFKTDAKGQIEIDTPWPGQYVAEATHREESAGEFDGQPFQRIRYVSTLTFENKT
ncbi:DUF4198 domain-containing protein [Schauerella aestuarii]|uniref:DUF4198 domain-containing protein n=1 Tax=Schauerella aestuarii TaxID=2511204 RepID=UPI001369C027|nr:DUF4198 domain-containing protein [Achromobacter aestuarii]MYZ45812.1 DUF4198 domain-containing protein [Achromobacter aestuarii]